MFRFIFALLVLTLSTSAFATDYREFAFLVRKGGLTVQAYKLHQNILADGTIKDRELQAALLETQTAEWLERLKRKFYEKQDVSDLSGQFFMAKYEQAVREIQHQYLNPNPDELKHVIELYSDLLRKHEVIKSDLILGLSLMLTFSPEWLEAHRPILISIPKIGLPIQQYEHHIAFMKAGETIAQFHERIHFGGLSVMDISTANGKTTVRWRPASQLNLKNYVLVDSRKFLLSQVFNTSLNSVEAIGKMDKLIQIPLPTADECVTRLQAQTRSEKK